jgi:hypothetical protein
MKAKAKVYRGIEYVIEGELPVSQQALLAATNTIERIKILVDGEIIANCILYKDYSAWYHTTVAQELASTRPVQEETITVRLALNKGFY